MEKEKAVPGKNGRGLVNDYPKVTTLDLENKEKFITPIYEGLGGYIEVREIGKKARSLFFTYDELKEYYPGSHNNIYIGMFTRKTKYSGKADNCLESRVLWADFDNETLDQVREKTKDLKPNIIVNSGHGYHTYWLLTEAYGPEILRPVLRAIAEALGSDSRTAEPARIMRLPGTWNVKGDPVKCKLISYDIKAPYSLENIKKHYPETRQPEARPEILIPGEAKPCILGILKGVPEGDRNLTTGRLTKELQIKGYTKERAYNVLKAWNDRNDPPEQSGPLYNSFRAYWKTDYKLLGCKMPTKDLQTKLNKYCDRKNCPFNGPMEIILENTVKINNRIFTNYKKITGYDLILYAVLLSELEGLNVPQILTALTLKQTRPVMTRKTLYGSLETLEKTDLIEVTRKQGRATFAKAINKGNYGTGYTILSNGATLGAINGDILPHEFKLYVLLLKYAFGKGQAYPSEATLAKDLGVISSSVSKTISGLSKAGYVKREYYYTPQGNEKLRCYLKV
jgi:hypothetical protein